MNYAISALHACISNVMIDLVIVKPVQEEDTRS